MNKFNEIIFIFLFFSFIISVIPFGNADVLNDSINISGTIDAPVLIISIIEDSINLGNITKGYITKSKPFNITNIGTTDATVQVSSDLSDEIFSNLLMGNSSTTGYKKASEFIGRVSQGDKEDFWIKLDLTNYSGDFTGDFSKQITFTFMPA